MTASVYKDFETLEKKSKSTYRGGSELQRGMNHVMIDMETLGDRNDAVVLSMGAVYFNPHNGETGPEFYVNVDPRSCQKLGMSISIGSIDWWFKQDKEVYLLTRSDPPPVPIDMALLQFQEWLNVNHRCPELWSNGDCFDNAILETACHLCNLPYPTVYRNRRDVRTLVALGKTAGVGKPKREQGAMTHHALEDAKYQVVFVSHIWQQLVRR